MSVRIVLCGDSRVEGYADKLDFPIVPGPATSFGTTYTTANGVIVTVTPQAAAPGNGFTCGVKKIVSAGASNGKLALFIQSRGSGYVANKMPSVSVSGGDGTPPDFSVNVLPAGGIAVRLETYLIANGFPGAVVINAGLDGQMASGWGNVDNYNIAMAEGSAGDPTSALIYMDVGVNDITSGRTVQQYHDDLLRTVSAWVSDGYSVMISYPFGYGTAGTTAQKALNPTIQSLSTQIDAIIATNPAKIFKGVDNYALVTPNDAYFSGDGLHQNAAGDDAIAAALGPRMVQVLPAPPAADPYQSENAIPVSVTPNYKPGAPNPFAASGLGTFLLPTVVLTYGVPANLPGGRIVFLRRIFGAATPYAIVGNVTGINASTPPVATWTDTAVVNGTDYQYTAYALPYGDF